ncbi:MAG: DUF928 domain-containing protein [Leptolyngbyaceae cyanobacterium CSU_1_3]|nr:DUF928 domain-containing protein [Leptolyngbyaceae cyanobacterium CSU_1_3]
MNQSPTRPYAYTWAYTCACSIGTAALLLLTCSPPLQARPTPAKPAQKRPPQPIRFVPPTPPDPGEPGGRGQGGGSRGECRPYSDISPLVPQSNWGRTTIDRPTLWFHAPQGLASGVAIEWVLRDDANQPLYKTTFRTPKTSPGVVSLSLPATAPPLRVSQTYRWTVFIYCNPEEPDQPVTLRGRIQRVAPSAKLQAQLATSTDALERATLYASDGIWHDALTTLGLQLRSQQTPPIVAALGPTYSSKPTSPPVDTIVPCCTFR